METHTETRERYHRQELIEGWNQKKLSEATVSIIGSDALAQYIALPLVALGVGEIRLVDHHGAQDEHFLGVHLGKSARVDGLEGILQKINPEVIVRGVPCSLSSRLGTYFLEGSTAVVDATNDPVSRAIALEYCVASKTPLIVAGSVPGYGSFMRYRGDGLDPRYLLHSFNGQPQDEFISLVFGGVVSDEVKKIVMGEEGLLNVPLFYSLLHADRFSPRLPGESLRHEIGTFRDKKVLIIGAGALGNFVGLGLSLRGVGRIDVMDPDVVEGTNLNRQVLFYDCVGEPKAKALAEKIKQISPLPVKTNGFVDSFTEKSIFPVEYDLLVDCVDSFAVRSVINDYSLERGIPLISGGTDARAGQVVVFVPGKTGCLDCQIGIHEAGVKAMEEQQRAGCLQAPNPSVITTNQTTAGIMINEAPTVFDSATYGEPINGTLRYITDADVRLGINPLNKVCDCKPKGGITIQLQQHVHSTEGSVNQSPVVLERTLRNMVHRSRRNAV